MSVHLARPSDAHEDFLQERRRKKGEERGGGGRKGGGKGEEGEERERGREDSRKRVRDNGRLCSRGACTLMATRYN